jgi:glucose-6-phosphate 1-epimerase
VTDDPCRTLESVGPDGARLTGCAHGGHVTGWWPPGSTTSRLWMSQSGGCGPGVAIRGGIPVVFPQFGVLGPLRKHGFVRDVPWTHVRPSDPSDRRAQAMLVFETGVGPTSTWPHEAGLRLTATAFADALTVHLQVHNTGQEPMPFTAALHTYLAVSQPGSVLTGLGGRLGTDAAAGGASVTLADSLATDTAMDVMVRDLGDAVVVLREPAGEVLTLTAEGFGDRVVWNPGPGHTLSDLSPGHEAHFVCVEPAVLTPVTLPGHERWDGTMTMRRWPPP